MNKSTAALEFAEKIGSEGNPSNIAQLFGRFISDFGFGCFSAGRVASEKRKELGGQVWLVSPHRWYGHWTSQRYAKIDPIVWYWRNYPHRQLASWSEIRSGSCGPRPDIFDEATDFGIREGLAVRIKIDRGDMATVALGTGERTVATDDRVTLNFAALVCTARLAQLNEAEPGAASLTTRQRECLSWAASGKTDWEISQILGLSQRTVQEHLSRCIAKLRAANRTQAVAIALLNRLISL